jgi:hypothetical protein
MTLDDNWKDIEGYEGLYAINDQGIVKNCITDKFLKQTEKDHGYRTVSLIKEKKCRQFLVHRLVAIAFLENPNNFPCVNHKDEDKTNNHVDNLEWCTYQYNNTYNFLVERNTEKKKKPVVQLDANLNVIKEWESIKDAETHTGIFNISHCCSRKRKTAGGYIWRLKGGVVA